MTFSPFKLWYCSEYADILGYVETKASIRIQWREVVTSLYDRNWLWGSAARICVMKNIKYWIDNQYVII
jgi:hypothetical protein